MAIRAASVEKEDRSGRPRGGGVKRTHMTLGAEPRVRDLEQPVVDGSVGIVAVGAIFERRRMRPKEWAAPLGMAGVAVFVDTGLFEL